MTDRNMKLCEDYRAIHREHIAKGESSDVVAADKICMSFFITEVRFLEQGGQKAVDNFLKSEYNYIVRKVRNILPTQGGFYMELAKVTSKGQVTIPIEIRKKLGIKNGDKVLFVEESGRIYMMNSSMDALREAQRAFTGEAERVGLKNDDDVMAMIKELRAESMVK